MRFQNLLVLTMVAGAVPAVAQAPIPPKEEQVMAAVLPLPENLRANARVIGSGLTRGPNTKREPASVNCRKRLTPAGAAVPRAPTS